MLFDPATSAATHGHTGYVAGRYRDGAYSDEWTDVRRCAPATFTAHAPACSCGWRGTPQPVNPATLIACARSWVTEHLGTLDRTTRPTLTATGPWLPGQRGSDANLPPAVSGPR